MGLSTRAKRPVGDPALVPYYILLFVVNGSVNLQVGDQWTRRVDAPSLLLIGKDQKSLVTGVDERPFQRHYYLLSGTWVDEWVGFGWLPKGVWAGPLPDLATAEMLHHRLATAVIEGDSLSLDEGKLDLARWLMRLNQQRAWQTRTSAGAERVRAVVEQWRKAPQAQANAAEWASRCNLSVSRLRAIIREAYGCGAHDLIVRTRVDYACRLMCQREDLLLKQVAYAAGFQNVETFNRCVLRHRRMTPGALRALLRSTSKEE